VRQRKAAIQAASGSFLLLLDDDVVLDPGCVAAMLREIEQPGVVAVTADFSNQSWSGPTVLWRWVLRYGYGLREGEWQGRVIGPLLRFGYRPSPAHAMPMQWLGSGNSLVRRDAYERAGGFSDFFLHRSTINEDVDLGLKLGRVGRIVLSPAARMAHLQAAGGRVSPRIAAEDDLFNRYLILRHTLGRSALAAFALICVYCTIETAGNLGGSLLRGSDAGFADRLAGRLKALARILVPMRSRPA
jgi:GT2 family glycosyltransferase